MSHQPPRPKIPLIDDQFTRHPGRYLQQHGIGSRWCIHDPCGTMLRELNRYEHRLVCSAFQPDAVNHVLRFEIGRVSHRILQVERDVRELSAALSDAEREIAAKDARIKQLEAMLVLNNVPTGNEAMAQ